MVRWYGRHGCGFASEDEARITHAVVVLKVQSEHVLRLKYKFLSSRRLHRNLMLQSARRHHESERICDGSCCEHRIRIALHFYQEDQLQLSNVHLNPNNCHLSQEKRVCLGNCFLSSERTRGMSTTIASRAIPNAC